jgi:hypothetical protein
MIRYFALWFPQSSLGYTLDYYPEERAAYWRENRNNIIGDFATFKEANAAVRIKCLELSCIKNAHRI